MAALAALLLLGGATGPGAAPSTVQLRPAAPQVTAELTPEHLSERLARFEEGRWLRDNGGKLRCGVRVLHYEYRTRGGAGEPVTASGALMVPTGGILRARSRIRWLWRYTERCSPRTTILPTLPIPPMPPPIAA